MMLNVLRGRWCRRFAQTLGGKLVSREKIAQILSCSLNDVTEYDTL